MSARLELKNISFSYEDENKILDKISFNIDSNDFLVLLGSSGCGKTTLLNIIAGLLSQSDGQVLIDGINVDDKDPKSRDVAMVFQNYALYPSMTVYNNIAFPLKNSHKNKSEIDNMVRTVATNLGILDLLQKKPHQLSGGQKQRVAIARAIVRRPKLFLMDEPLSNLDASMRNQMRQELKRIHKEIDSSIVYVTHDQIEALSLATKIIVLENGKIQQIGSPQELYSHPKNEFVASFIGIPKMNFVKNTKLIAENNQYYVELFGEKIYIDTQEFHNKNIDYMDVGIRPQDIQLAKDNNSNILIEYKEFNGNDFVYNISYCNEHFEVVSKLNLEEGERIKIIVNNSKLHFFDKNKNSLSWLATNGVASIVVLLFFLSSNIW